MAILKVAKYLLSGAIGISVNLGLYHILIAYGDFHYLAGSIVAVSCSTIIGFLLQKYWTFEDRNHQMLHTQFGLYVSLAILNIALNTLIVYALVSFIGAYYLFAQATAAAFVALWSFFIYREVIFRSRQIAQ
jgi:putative flippase GtrA